MSKKLVAPGITDNERKVLAYLVEEGCGTRECFSGFAPIIAGTQLERRIVRRACRSLKRKGLAEFGRGLWNDEGPAGSGYAYTEAGYTALIASGYSEE